MRKFIRVLPLLLFLFLFTSCIDYVQTVTYKDGRYQMYYKVTLSKVLFALADENPEEILSSFDENALGDLPENVIIKPVDTDLEVGAEIIVSIDPKTSDEAEKAFLPRVSGNKCYIPFLLGKEDGSIADSMKSDTSETQGIAEAIMSSAKCRVMISKKVIPKIEAAYFEGRGGQHYAIPVFDYGEAYCMEIPFIVLFENGMYKFDKIAVITAI